MPVSIAIANDHAPSADALATLIRELGHYHVVLMAKSGRDLLDQLHKNSLPDIALVELNMPNMDGLETTAQLNKLYPSIRTLTMSVTDNQNQTIQPKHRETRGHRPKEQRVADLRQALDDLMTNGLYHTDGRVGQSARNLGNPLLASPAALFSLNNREYRFLKMACSELTYNEIADQMCVSPRTVDGYREMVFQKMNVRSRVGMVIKAVRHKLVEL